MPTVADLKRLYPNLADYEDHEVVDIYAQNYGLDRKSAGASLGVQINDPGFGTTLNRSAAQMAGGVGEIVGDVTGDRNNAVSRYADDVTYRNPSGINSLQDVADNPWLALKEASANALTFAGPQLAMRGAGLGLQAYGATRGLRAAQLAGRAIDSRVAQGALAGLPSLGEIGQKQRASGEQENYGAKYLGAGAVGAVENLGGLQRLAGIGRGGRATDLLVTRGATPLRTTGRVLGRSMLEEGAEEVVQTPIEQVAGFQDPTTPESLHETALGGVMGTLGGAIGLPVAIHQGFKHSAANEQVRQVREALERRAQVDLLAQQTARPTEQLELDLGGGTQGALDLQGGMGRAPQEVALPVEAGVETRPVRQGTLDLGEPQQGELALTGGRPGITDAVVGTLRETGPKAFKKDGTLRRQSEKLLQKYEQFSDNEIGATLTTLRDDGKSAPWHLAMLEAIANERQRVAPATAGAAPVVAGGDLGGGTDLLAGQSLAPVAADTAPATTEPGAAGGSPAGGPVVLAAGPTGVAPLTDSAVAQMATERGDTLPPVQQKVFDHIREALEDGRADEVIDAKGVLMYENIARALGLKRGSVKSATDGMQGNIAKFFGRTAPEVKAALQERAVEAARSSLDVPDAPIGQAPAQVSAVDERDIGDAGSLTLINSEGGTQRGVVTAPDKASNAASAAEPNPVLEQRQAQATAQFKARIAQVLGTAEAHDAQLDWDESRSDAAPDFAALDDLTKVEWVGIYVSMMEGGIGLDQANQEQQRIERELAEDARAPERSTREAERIESSSTGADRPADAGVRRGDNLAGEAPDVPVRADPFEQRVARLRELGDAGQNKRIDRLVKRFADDPKFDIERFANELEALETDAFAPDKGGKGIRYSRGEGSGSTVRAILDAIRPLFVSPAQFARKVTVVQSADELTQIPEASSVAVDESTQAFVVDGRAYLIAGNIAQGQELAVFLHEVGVHLGMRGLIGAKNMSALSAQIDTWAQRVDESVESQIAARAVERATSAEGNADAALLAEEKIAYFVEEAVNAGINPMQATGATASWFRKFWAAVKVALRKFGFNRLDKLTAQDVVSLAHGAAKLELEGAYHGTAAEFRRFDHRHMGTGEGAQAFGWGTYLAQKPGIAHGYRKADVKRKGRVLDGIAPPDAYYAREVAKLRKAIAELEAHNDALSKEPPTRWTRHTTDANNRQLGRDREALELAMGKAAVGVTDAGRRITTRELQALHTANALGVVGNKLDPEWRLRLTEFVSTPWRDSSNIAAGQTLLDEGVRMEFREPDAPAQGPQGTVLRADVNVRDEEMLDWFEVLDEQSEHVQQAVKKLPRDMREALDDHADNPTGQTLYKMLVRDIRGGAFGRFVDDTENYPKAASMVLDSLGIKGVKFDDAMSRTKDGGTKNLVIFNDKNIVRAVSHQGGSKDQPRFSKASSVTAAAQQNIPEAARPAVKYAATTIREAVRSGSNLVKFTEDLVRSASGILPSAKQWYAELARREQVHMHHKAKIDDLANRVDQLGREEFKRTWDLIHDMTSKQVWAYKPTWRKGVEVDPTQKARYDKLSVTEQKLLDDILRHGHETQNEVRAVLDELVEAERTDAMEAAKTPEQVRKVEKRFESHRTLFGLKAPELAGPYSPMTRVGSHVVVARSKAYMEAAPKDQIKMKADPKHYRMAFRDSQAQAQKLADELEPEFEGGDVDAAIREAYTQQNVLPFEAFEKLRRQVEQYNDPDSDKPDSTVRKLSTLVNELYLTSLVDTSARKSSLRRHGVAGLSADDMYRAFVAKGESDAFYLGALKNGRTVAQAYTKMRTEANAVGPQRHERRSAFNELATRYDNSLRFNDSPLVGKLLNFSSMWMLLTKPAYFFYNATQPLMLTQPALAAKHGYKRSMDAMFASYKELMGLKAFTNLVPFDLKKLPADVREAVIELRDMGRIDITITQDLGARIHGARTKSGRAMQSVERTLKAMAQKVEMTNRVVTAVAAYRLSREKGATHEAAVKYASDLIYDTHGDYSNTNAPRAMNANGALRVMTQFRKFQFIQIAQLWRMGRDAMQGKTAQEKWMMSRALRYTLGHHALLAGSMGMPAANVIAMFFAMSGDDDEPRELESSMRRAIGDGFMADLLTRGVPAIFNIDISANVGMGQTFSILPFADTGFGDRGGYEKVVTAATGPLFGGFGLQAWNAMGALKNGDYYKGLEGMLPSGLRAATKAMREGLGGVTNYRGDTLVPAEEVAFMATVLKALGFRTQADGVRWLTSRNTRDFETFFNDRTSALKADYVKAYEANEPRAMAQARQEFMHLQGVRHDLGFKRQAMSNLLKAPKEKRERERDTVRGVQFDSGSERFVRAAQ